MTPRSSHGTPRIVHACTEAVKSKPEARWCFSVAGPRRCWRRCVRVGGGGAGGEGGGGGDLERIPFHLKCGYTL